MLDLDRDHFLKARDFLKQNCETYDLLIDNDEKHKRASISDIVECVEQFMANSGAYDVGLAGSVEGSSLEDFQCQIDTDKDLEEAGISKNRIDELVQKRAELCLQKVA